MSDKARKNELTAVIGRRKFEEYPGGVTSSHDRTRWRRFRDRYNGAQELAPPRSFPLQIDFELNSTCQMTCGFCTHGAERVPRRELSFDDFKRVIDEGAEYGLASIKLNYINEPLLNRSLLRFVDYAKARGVLNVYFATNGLLLSREVARGLVASKVSKVMVSLDAVTPETFKVMRQSDQLKQIVKNIKNLIEVREEAGVTYPFIRVNFLKTRLNEHEADRFIEYWEGVADMVGLQDQVQLPGVEEELLPERYARRDSFRCAFPFKLVVIDSGGDILPCCTFSGRLMPLGNIDKMTVSQAWNSSAMRDLREIHYAGLYATNSICRHCVGGS